MNRSQLGTVSNANEVLIVFVFETRPAQLPLIPRLMRFTQFRKCFFSSWVVYLPFVQSWKTAWDWHNALCIRRESDTGNYRLVWFKGLSLWYFVFDTFWIDRETGYFIRIVVCVLESLASDVFSWHVPQPARYIVLLRRCVIYLNIFSGRWAV